MSARGRTSGLAEQVLVLVVLCLVAFGVVMVYSASSAWAAAEVGNSLYFLERHAVYALIGLVAFAVCARIDYRRLASLAPLVLVVSLAGLALVAAAGVSRNGAQRWLELGGFTAQPAEFAKLAVLLFAAAVLAARTRPLRTVSDAMAPVGWTVIVVCGVLVALQRDLGSAIAVALAAGAVLTIACCPAGVLARMTVAGVALAGLMIYIEPYRRERFLAFLDPGNDPQNAGYQLTQAALAIGRGGLTGVGLGQSTFKTGSVPEQHTDMIAAIVGEELGLLGIVAVIAAFAAIGWAGTSIALNAKDPFGKLLAGGATALVCGQAAINLGGVLGILPLTGVPLPFVSFGGSALIAMLASLGLVVSVAAHGSTSLAPARRQPARKPARKKAASRPAAKPRKRAAAQPRKRTAAAR